MNGKLKVIIGFAAFAVFIAAAVFAYNYLGEKAQPQIEAEEAESGVDRIKAPDFTVQDANGNAVKLSDFVGTPVVVNFWASWCPPCKAEMPEFDKVYQELAPGVAFMMVDLTDGQQETVEKGKQYIEEQGFLFPVYFDTEQEAAYAYGISSIPTTLFIDDEGYIVTGAQGAISEEILRKGIGYIYPASEQQ